MPCIFCVAWSCRVPEGEGEVSKALQAWCVEQLGAGAGAGSGEATGGGIASLVASALSRA